MKIFSALVFITISLCAGFCCPEEEDYNSIEIQDNNIISIENDESVFQLNDVIYVNTLISNNQKTSENEDISITGYLDSNTEITLGYNLVLYKETNFGTLAKIKVTDENIIVLDGMVVNIYEEIIQVTSVYDDTNFKSNFGIKLLETGTYYLASSYIDSNSEVFIIGINGNNSLSITTKIINSEENGGYKFVVD